MAKLMTHSKKKHAIKEENHKRNKRKYILHFSITKNIEEKNIWK